MSVRGAAQRAVIRAAVLATADDLGTVTADGVVAAAADEASPLHLEFEWDNGIAAHQHRLAQARGIIREITFETVDTARRPISSVSYVHRPGSRQQAYVPLSRVAKSKKLARAVLEEEFARCEGSIRRAREVANVLNLSGELDELLRGLLAIRRKIAA